MKIQINSLDALERLIGGDTEIEIEVRQSVAENFAKKHLKSLANDELNKAASESFINIIKEEWTEKLPGYYDKYGLTGAVKEMLKMEVCLQMKPLLEAEVQKIIKTTNYESAFTALIERQSNYIIELFTSKNIEDRINFLVDAKIKNKLGLK